MSRVLPFALCVALLASGPAFGKSAASSPTSTPVPVDMVSCRDGTMTRVPVKSGSCSHHGGVGPAAPAGSTAVCKDGTFTSTKEHKGACSGHKGVDRWLDQ